MRRALLLVPVLLLGLWNTTQAQNADSVNLLNHKEPSYRIEGAKRLLRDGDRKSVNAVMAAIVSEQDGATGREMGLLFKDLKSADGFSAAERTLLGYKKTSDMFGAYWMLSSLAQSGHESADKIVLGALDKGDKRDVSLRACAFEAIGDCGRSEFDKALLDAVNAYKPEDDAGNVFETLAALSAVRKRCPASDLEAQKPYLLALIHVLDNSNDDRIKYFAALGLSRVSGKQPFLSGGWWRNWLMHGDKAEDAAGAVPGKTGASFFDAVAVGTRVVYAIDVSGSMNWPADMDFASKPVTGERQGSGPDYSKVKTKLDLAKVELIWSLENLPEHFHFNIVTYESKHQFIDEATTELIQATPANKAKMIAAVNALKAEGGTNIHGSLKRCFATVRKGKVKDDPSLDRVAMLEGVDTIFFLTDGTPSWCDESTQVAIIHPKWGGIGDGKFCNGDNILADISRMNTFRKIVIHAISVGADADKKLMKNLAEQNHGKHVDRG